MMWKLIRAVIVLSVLISALVFWLMFSGQGRGPVVNWFVGNPHMIWQPHLRAFDARMPPSPPGAVPVTPSGFAVPTTQEAAKLTSPLGAPTPDDLRRGAVYYQYYCVACHGNRGDGAGPVGDSYIPRPADLRTARVKAMSDGELLRASLTGTGHQVEGSPHSVLGYTVLPQHRWYLMAYVRTFARSGNP